MNHLTDAQAFFWIWGL